MPIPFGPQLVGMLEKTTTVMLRHCLASTGLTEAEWVALRLAVQRSPQSSEDLAATVRDLAQFEDAADIVRRLHDRRLLERDHLTDSGRDLMAEVEMVISRTTNGLWTDLPADDIAAAERTLNTILRRASTRLGTL